MTDYPPLEIYLGRKRERERRGLIGGNECISFSSG
jgi:hypothetical protein